MIYVDGGKATLHGSMLKLLSETTIVLAAVYGEFKSALGEHEARKILAEMGQAAVDEDMMEGLILDKKRHVTFKE